MPWGKLLFGGTFGYIQAALIGTAAIALVWIWQDYKGAKRDVVRLQGEVTTLHGTIESKDGVIASMGRTAQRRDTDSDKSKDLADDILKAKDGTSCASSGPIVAVLDGLLNDTTGGASQSSDKTIPMLAGAYPTTDN